MTEPWSDERVALLRRLVDEGKSAREAGEIMGVTRAAAIGKALRLKITFGLSEASSPKAKAQHTRKVPPIERPAGSGRRGNLGGGPQLMARVETDARRRAKSKPAAFEVPPTSRPFTDLEAHQCRYGLNDPGVGYMDRMICCGAPTPVGEPFCTEHRAICWTPAKRMVPKTPTWHRINNRREAAA